jgi:hypothetical protein
MSDPSVSFHSMDRRNIMQSGLAEIAQRMLEYGGLKLRTALMAPHRQCESTPGAIAKCPAVSNRARPFPPKSSRHGNLLGHCLRLLQEKPAFPGTGVLLNSEFCNIFRGTFIK